jgi:uncharacterized protein YecE (DUF72 family)
MAPQGVAAVRSAGSQEADANSEPTRFKQETVVTQLSGRLGPLLGQLPPSLSFPAETAKRFFAAFRERFDDAVAVKARHANWFGPVAECLLQKYRLL